MNDNQKIKTLKIELSKFCLNNCVACTYSKNDRNNDSLFDLIKFEKIIKNFSYYCEQRGCIPDLQLGVGEVLVFDLNPYFDIIEKYNKKALIELTTTGKFPEFKDKIDELYNRFNNTGIEILIEFGFDLITVVGNELEIIKEAYEYVKNKEIFEIYNNLKISVHHEDKIEEIVKFIEYLGFDLFVIDYIYADNNKINKLMDIYRYSDFYKNLSSILKEKNIKIMNELTCEYEKTTDYNASSKLAYFLNTNEELYFVLEIPFGEFTLNTLNSNFKAILNNNNMSKEKFNNILNVQEKLIHDKNVYLSSNEKDVCFNCEYKYYCPLSLVSEFSKFNNIEFSENYCIGLKNLK
jgi:hypothetical protein